MGRIWSWKFWSRYSNFNARRHGRIDGAKGIPLADQEERTGYEMELKQAGEELIKQIDREWSRLDSKLKSGYCTALGECRSAQSAAQQAETDYQARSQDYEQVWNKMKEAPYVRLNPTPYWLIMIFLGIAEFPLNAIVFRLFGDSEALTFLFSSVLGFGLPCAAHFLGMSIKKRPFNEEGLTADKLLTILLTVIPIFVIIGVAYLREQYIEREIDITLGGFTLFFVAVNFLVFLVALMASYFAHDADFEKARHDLKRAKERLKTAESNLKTARSQVAQAEERLQRNKAEREKTFDGKKGEVGEINDFIQRVISVYRTHNIRARASQVMPNSFKDYPEIKVPGTLLKELEWECPDSVTGYRHIAGLQNQKQP
jgi:hypothetical protein